MYDEASVDHGDAGRGEWLDHAPAEFIEVVERGRGRCVDGCVDLSGDIGYGCGNGVWVWEWGMGVVMGVLWL